MKRAAESRYWLIQGFDSHSKIFEIRVALGQFSDKQMKHLLRALAAKASLNYGEIVGAYAKRKTRIANDLLEIRDDLTNLTYSCGTNPSFIVRVVDETGKHFTPAFLKRFLRV